MQLDVRTQRREQMIDISRQVTAAVADAGVREGSALIYCPHTTAAIAINEAADPDVPSDILATLSKLIPLQGRWRHAEGNSDAHVKAMLVGPSVVVPIAEGRLSLGRWQGIFLCEFDGPRDRSVTITVTAASRP